MVRAERGVQMFDYMMNEKQLSLRDEVRGLVEWVPRQMVLDMDADKIKFPEEFMREAGRRKLMGCRYPQKWGGREMDWETTCMVMEEVGTLGYIFACIFGINGELVADAVVQHGTDEQKERYVVPTLQGKKFAAECLTEPRGGSDFFGTTTTAEDRGDHFLINGEKRFIVGAESADYFMVYALTDADAEPQKSLTCFLVDRGPGVSAEYIYRLMGCRGGGAGRLSFRDVKVPRENVLGEVNGAYAIFNTMMIPERLGTAAMTVGAARPAVEIATAYSSRREAFGHTINEFQGVSFQIADAVTLLDASRAMVNATARAVDAGVHPHRIRRMVSETKKFVTESCQEAVHKAMQVMGGIGYTDVYPLERTVRDLRLSSIWTGTNEVMSMIVAGEWYREHHSRAGEAARDFEADATAAMEDEEKFLGE